MLQGWFILLVSLAYIGLLFAIAYYGDKRADAGRSLISNPYTYALSMGVYCTAWTFYGSVGRAASAGVGFLPKQVAAFEPDLILLDVMMPHINGFDVCRRIRENPAWQNIKIIMLTAKGREVEMAKGLALGADAYITKPFSTKELLAQVRHILEDNGSLTP